MVTNDNPEKGPRTLGCEAWEAMLTDALDGTLDARDAEAFEAHSKDCAAGCGELLEEAKRGSEWLRFLRETPAAPEGLLEKILVGTSGLPDAAPLTAGGAVALPRQPWLGVSVAMLQRHVAESRILMTLAMAFFSIALTLNLTGVRLNQLKLSDLSPAALATSLSHQYYTTSAHLVRYYSNLRIFYELESRVNEMRRDETAPAAQPQKQQNQQQPQKPQPQAQPSSGGKSGGGKPGGSARKSGSVPPAEQRQSRYEAPVRVLAGFQPHGTSSGLRLLRDPSEPHPHLQVRRHSRIFSSDSPFLSSERPGNHHKPLERSLV